MNLEEENDGDHVADGEEETGGHLPVVFVDVELLAEDRHEVARVAAVVEVRSQSVRNHDRRDSRGLPITTGRHLKGEDALI